MQKQCVIIFSTGHCSGLIASLCMAGVTAGGLLLAGFVLTPSVRLQILRDYLQIESRNGQVLLAPCAVLATCLLLRTAPGTVHSRIEVRHGGPLKASSSCLINANGKPNTQQEEHALHVAVVGAQVAV
jgi:hypothetical protein